MYLSAIYYFVIGSAEPSVSCIIPFVIPALFEIKIYFYRKYRAQLSGIS